MWTNTSFEPSSGWMKPKPFWELNHLTVPCDIVSHHATRRPTLCGPEYFSQFGSTGCDNAATEGTQTHAEKRRAGQIGPRRPHYQRNLGARQGNRVNDGKL